MVQYASSGVTSTFTTYFTPLGGDAITDQSLHFGGMEPEVDFISSYDVADLRGQNQGFFFNELDGITFNNSLYKFFYDGYRTANGVSNKDFPLIRYADVLLTYAEAQNESGSSADATAYEALNAVRSRAGLTDVSGLSKSEFREEVLKQRVLEFPAEAGLIWFDMRRTMKAFNGTGFNDFVGHTLPNGKTLSADHIYFPTPQSEVVLNPNLGD